MPPALGSGPPPNARRWLRSAAEARLAPRPALARRTLLGGVLGLAACAAAEASAPLTRSFALPAWPNGSLRLLGALELDRSVLGFGGLSGLHLDNDLTVSVVSDAGRQARFRLVLDAEMRPRQMDLLSRGPLRDGAGRPLPRGHAGDAESLARLADGTWLVGFERWHRIRAYRDMDGPGLYIEAPADLAQAPANGGLEALAVLQDGRWLALAEDLAVLDGPGLSRGWIGRPGDWSALAYRPAPGFVPVDAAPLPGGGALVLERSFSIFRGFRARLVRLPEAALLPGAVLEGEEILRLDQAPLAENWEGVAAVRYGGRVLVALITDDNENSLQRSLFLLAELAQ